MNYGYIGFGICRDTYLHSYKATEGDVFLQMNKLDSWHACIDVYAYLCYMLFTENITVNLE